MSGKMFPKELTGVGFRILLSSVFFAITLSACGKGDDGEPPASRSDQSYSQWLADHQIQATDPQIVELAKQITRGDTDAMGKASSIHDWVTANIQYDQALYSEVQSESSATQIDASYDDCEATHVLQTHKAICDGYASLTASLLVASGVPAKMVTGTLSDQGVACDHEWNKALVDGQWIIIDTTFDAGGWGRQFFNPTPEFFAQTHQECNESSGH
jgi:transglutaminase/protease-like cytokinesis protein 3